VKLVNVPPSIDPPAFNGAVNVAVAPDATFRKPESVAAVVAGIWLRIEAGTVKVLWPAVVRQMN
jgi:hypothetical protein